MTKSFLPHLSTILLVHVLFLAGTWQLSQISDHKDHLSKLGSSTLKLQVASKVIINSAQVQKKNQKVVPTHPLKPETAPMIQEKMPLPVSESTHQTAGSEFGTNSKGRTDQLSVYKAELRAMIDKNKYYPAISRRLGQTGTVVVAFTLLEDGNIIDVRIDRPSRFSRLNSSALEAVMKVERFRPIPKEIGGGRMDIKVPLKFVTI